MQFYLEYLLRYNHPGSFYIMPTFRGEDPDERHLNEFFHAEVEIVESLEEVMALVESYISCMIHDIDRAIPDKIRRINPRFDDILNLVQMNIPKISYNAALNLVKDDVKLDGSGIPLINEKGERKLIEHFKGAVWLTGLPHKSVPFYQAFDKDRDISKSADLLVGIGETVGSGERHFSSEDIIEALNMHKVNRLDYDWYIEMKQHFPLRTSGFGLGVERFLLWVTGTTDIREITLFSRLKNKRKRRIFDTYPKNLVSFTLLL